MSSNTQHTAILLFARTAEAEARHKRVCAGQSASTNYQVLKHLEHHAEAVATQSGLPVFRVSELEQYGNNFGARLHNAFEAVFEQGYTNVLAIGSDCAQLSATNLAHAASQLQQHQTVLGPARDGGVYLLGLSKAQFYRSNFAEVSWCTQNVFEQLKAFDAKAVVLATLSDIDRTADLVRVLLSNTLPETLLRSLRALLPVNPAHYTVVQEAPVRNTTFLAAQSRRGPPMSA